MKCTNCGFENEENARFCESCGAQMAQETEKASEETTEAPKEAPAKSIADTAKGLLKNKTALIGIAAIAVIVILLVIVISAIANSGNGFIERDAEYIAAQNEDGDIVVINGKKLLKNTIDLEEPDDSYFRSQEESIDGKVLAGIAEDTLYVIRKNKITKVAEEVDEFVLSVNGDTIVYSVIDEEEEEATLVFYTVKNGKTKEIAKSDEESYVSNFIVSPNGKAVAYTVEEFDEDEDDGTKSTAYYYNGKKSEKITSADIDLIAMADGGKYIYATAEEETEDEGTNVNLYIYNKKGEKKTKLGTVSTKTLRFNIDCTQVIYYTQNDKGDNYTYMSIKGKDGVKLAKARLTLVTNGMDTVSYYPGYANVYPVDDLYNHVYVATSYTEEGYTSDAYLVKKGEGKTVKLVSGINDYTLDESGDYFYYMESDDKDSTLMVLKVKKGENAKDKAVAIAEDVEDYVVTSDRKKVYFISDEGLYRVNGKKGGKTKTIASDEVSGRIVISEKDVVYYMDSDNTLYATTGGKGKKIMDDAYYTEYVNGGVYIIDEDNGLYIANKKQKPKKLMNMYEESVED